MPELKTPIDVLKILPKTNCNKCNLKTCLAFAANVINGAVPLADCPDIDPEILAQYQPPAQARRTGDDDAAEGLAKMEEAASNLDLPAVAQNIGGRMVGDKLAVKVLGKDFMIGPDGKASSAQHLIGWVLGPLYSYVLTNSGREPQGDWVPFRELKGGEDWKLFFNRRCEQALKQVIDRYTNLFELMIDIFDAEPAPDMFQSDIAVKLLPFPRLPILLCYWKPEDGMESDFNLFFDKTATDNIGVDQIYTLGVGLTMMFEKIGLTHGQ